MGRYLLDPNQSLIAQYPHVEVIVGWDNPLQTFFAQVLDPDQPDDQNESLFWTGTRPAQITSIEALEEHLQPYAPLPDDVRHRLEQEYAARTEPTPLQQWVLGRMRS